MSADARPLAERRADPRPISLKHFIYLLKEGTIFPAGAINEALADLPEDLLAERRSYAEWRADSRWGGLLG